MEIPTQGIFDYVLMPLGLVAAWAVRMFFGRITTLEQQYASLRILIAEEYVKRDDIAEMLKILNEIRASTKKE